MYLFCPMIHWLRCIVQSITGTFAKYLLRILRNNQYLILTKYLIPQNTYYRDFYEVFNTAQ